MSLKSSIIALAGTIGRCQENSRSIKQALELGLVEMSKDASGLDGAISTKKLWVNANPTTAFAPGDITIDNSDDYDAFIIYFASQGNFGYIPFMVMKSAINDSTKHYFIEQKLDSSNGKVSEPTRSGIFAQAEGSSNVVITMSGCTVFTIDTYGSEATSSTSNNKLIPEVIIGVKF